jgi:hypothetical protein
VRVEEARAAQLRTSRTQRLDDIEHVRGAAPRADDDQRIRHRPQPPGGQLPQRIDDPRLVAVRHRLVERQQDDRVARRLRARQSGGTAGVRRLLVRIDDPAPAADPAVEQCLQEGIAGSGETRG